MIWPVVIQTARRVPVRLWLAGGAIALVAVALVGWRLADQAADRAEAQAREQRANVQAGREASTTRSANEDADQQTREQVQEATDAIRNETDPAARDRLARERLCQLEPRACVRGAGSSAARP